MINDAPVCFHLTFDVEEWIPTETGPANNLDYKNTDFSRDGCIKLAELLKRYDAKATFFVTGYFAERQPQIVRALAAEGHEIASHAYNHVDLRTLGKIDLRTSLLKSTDILSNLISKKIKGFRAPECFINDDVIRTLEELGYRYDSSIHPAIVPGHYYNWGYPLTPYILRRQSEDSGAADILEIPISVIPLVRCPISWWWMRNIGNWLTHLGSRINLMRNRSVVLYFHPWEFVKLPNVKGMPLFFTRYCGNDFLRRLEKFISVYANNFSFFPLEELSTRYSAGNQK